MSNMERVIYNRDLFTYIVSFMPRDQLKVLVDQFRQYVHYDYIVPTKHSLMYGQVQSGKTGKIMSYITGYKPEIPKVLMVPNNLFMLKQ